MLQKDTLASLSQLLPQCYILVRNLEGDRELQKKDPANETLKFGVFGLWSTLPLRSEIIERGLGANDA